MNRRSASFAAPLVATKFSAPAFASSRLFEIRQVGVESNRRQMTPLVSMRIEKPIWALAAVGSRRMLQFARTLVLWWRNQIIVVAAARGRTQFVFEMTQTENDVGYVTVACAAAKGHATAALELLARCRKDVRHFAIALALEIALAHDQMPVFDAMMARVECHRTRLSDPDDQAGQIYRLMATDLARVMIAAAFKGNILAMQRLSSVGVVFDDAAARAAVAGGHEDVIAREFQATS